MKNIDKNFSNHKIVQIPYNIGIVVGRFQVVNLTEAHKKLIQYAIDKNQDVIIFLGSESYDNLSTRNPFPFWVRKQMILDEFKEYSYKLSIYPIEDKNFFPLWVTNLDSMIISIGESIHPIELINDLFITNKYYLYGGRDSFLDGYKKYSHSTFHQEELDFGINYVSGTEQRKEILNELIFKENELKNDDKFDEIYNKFYFMGKEYKKNDEIKFENIYSSDEFKENFEEFKKGLLWQAYNGR